MKLASSVQRAAVPLFMDTATNAFPPSGARTGWTDGERGHRAAGRLAVVGRGGRARALSRENLDAYAGMHAALPVASRSNSVRDCVPPLLVRVMANQEGAIDRSGERGAHACMFRFALHCTALLCLHQSD